MTYLFCFTFLKTRFGPGMINFFFLNLIHVFFSHTAVAFFTSVPEEKILMQTVKCVPLLETKAVIKACTASFINRNRWTENFRNHTELTKKNINFKLKTNCSENN